MFGARWKKRDPDQIFKDTMTSASPEAKGEKQG